MGHLHHDHLEEEHDHGEDERHDDPGVGAPAEAHEQQQREDDVGHVGDEHVKVPDRQVHLPRGRPGGQYPSHPGLLDPNPLDPPESTRSESTRSESRPTRSESSSLLDPESTGSESTRSESRPSPGSTGTEPEGAAAAALHYPCGLAAFRPKENPLFRRRLSTALGPVDAEARAAEREIDN